jgi:hypothetical protein
MSKMTPEEAKQVGGSPMFAAMRQLSEDGTYKRLNVYFMAAHWWEVWDALLASLVHIEALEKALQFYAEGNVDIDATTGKYGIRAREALAAEKTSNSSRPKPIAPEPQVLIRDWVDRFDTEEKP